ncbi:MAG: YjfB family protein [Gammaproteobacteria bacterium]|nr:YjfB family protein [Gammaproteobacteria bacterium]
MDISAVSNSLLRQIGNSATQTGDAVSISLMRKAMDIQSSQATQLIESVAGSMSDPGTRLGSIIDVKA